MHLPQSQAATPSNYCAVVVVSWCFTPSQPVRLYQGEYCAEQPESRRQCPLHSRCWGRTTEAKAVVQLSPDPTLDRSLALLRVQHRLLPQVDLARTWPQDCPTLLPPLDFALTLGCGGVTRDTT